MLPICAVRQCTSSFSRVLPILLCASPNIVDESLLTPLPPLHASLDALPSDSLPAHLAVVMDGNARWARRHRLPRVAGHEAGVGSLRTLISNCASLTKLQTLTVYAFSAENWGRPADEVSALMGLIEATLEAEAEELHANGVRLAFIGEIDRLPNGLRALAERLEGREAPLGGTRLLMCVALSYGGRQSLARATRALAERVRSGDLEPEAIGEAELAEELRRSGGGPPSDPDMVLRTGGQQRLSNFLTYECAYAELHTTDCLWPDFGSEALAEALRDYSTRRRTLGVR